MMPAISLTHYQVMQLVEKMVKAEAKMEKYPKDSFVNGHYDGIYDAYYDILLGLYSDLEIEQMKKEFK